MPHKNVDPQNNPPPRVNHEEAERIRKQNEESHSTIMETLYAERKRLTADWRAGKMSDDEYDKRSTLLDARIEHYNVPLDERLKIDQERARRAGNVRKI